MTLGSDLRDLVKTNSRSVLVAALLCWQATAISRSVSFEAMATNADQILVGEVVSIAPYDGDEILGDYMVYSLAVSEVWAGTQKVGSTVSILVPGKVVNLPAGQEIVGKDGSVYNQLRSHYIGEPTFGLGSEYLVYLKDGWKPYRPENTHYVAAGDQGGFAIHPESSEDGEPIRIVRPMSPGSDRPVAPVEDYLSRTTAIREQ